MYLWMLMGTMLKSGWRNQRSDRVILLKHLFLEIKMRWGSTGREMACVRCRKGILLGGS